MRSHGKLSCGTKRLLAGGAAALTVAGVALANPKPATQNMTTAPIAVQSRAIPGFNRTDRNATRFGKLEWRGGLVLSSPEKAFGGWSGLVLSPDGKRFVAVSDAGSWMTGKLQYRGKVLSGIQGTKLGPLLALKGKKLRRNRYRDAEGATLLSGTLEKGTLLISFEQLDRIGRFPLGKKGVGAPSQYLNIPSVVKERRSTDGIEAVAVLNKGPAKGSIVAIAERLMTKDGHHAAWFLRGGKHSAFAVRDIGGFDITDAAVLPDGDLLILERRFRWSEGVKIRLRRLAASKLKPGAVMDGETLLQADISKEIDNMEGLGVHTNAAGETIVTLISDDNFNRFFQRTLLLQFALAGKRGQQAKN